MIRPSLAHAERALRRSHRRAHRGTVDPEEVRRRMAGELHDCALQLLLAAHQDLEQSRANEAGVARSRATLDSAIAEIRRILSGEPGPTVLERGGLAAGLRELCHDASRRAGLTAVCEVDPGAADGPYDDLLYILAREFVENTIKHAGAGRLELSVRVRAPHIELTVTDDGSGIRSGDRPRPRPRPRPRAGGGHLGLQLAEYRVRGARGTLWMDVGPQGGTRMRVLLPEHAPPGA